MTYKNVSIDTVIGKILRDTRMNDLNYTADMPEWIGEVLQMTLGTRQLKPKQEALKVCFHKAKLPCALISLDGVAYRGRRLRYRSIEGTVTAGRSPEGFTGNYQTTITDGEVSPGVSGYLYDWQRMDWTPSDHWYSLEPGYIVTSMKDADISIWFRTIEHDDKGLPMIPDNPYLKDAIYWYVRAKLIGTGWKDPVYGLDDRMPMERYDDRKDRAISSMDFATPDMAAGMGDVNLRFYPPEGYWETMGTFVSADNMM